MKRKLPLLLFGFGLAAACEAPEEANMSAEDVASELSDIRVRPGLWELSSEVLDVRAANLPREIRTRMIGPRSRMRHCITPEQAEQPSANFLAMRADSACVYRDFTLQDGRLSGTMTCPGATARMQGRYGPESYVTQMEMRSPMPGGEVMTLQIRAQGRRTGECGEEKAK